MASDIKEIWKEALRLLQDEMTSVSFSTWIEPIVPVSLENIPPGLDESCAGGALRTLTAR